MKPVQIACWLLVWTGIAFASCVVLLGPKTIWQEIGYLRPYSSVFLSMRLLESDACDKNNLVFFFGDSSVAGPFLTQRDPAYLNVPRILEAKLQSLSPLNRRINVIDWSFAGASMFEYYCLLCKAAKYKPSLLIVPINWRMFSPMVYDNPDWDFSELSELAPLHERFQSGISNPLELEDISAPRHLAFKVSFLGLYASGIKHWLMSHLRESKQDPLMILARTAQREREKILLRIFEKSNWTMRKPRAFIR
jgi:hypothetical protein